MVFEAPDGETSITLMTLTTLTTLVTLTTLMTLTTLVTLATLATPGLALSRAGRAPSLPARAEPNLTSARSAHERFGMASRATSEPRASHYNGSARLAVTPRWLARSRLARTARRAYMRNIHFVRFS